MGAKCTACKEGEIIEKEGKYGTFYSCDKYPNCKTVYVKDDDGNFSVKEKKVIKTTGKPCPECQKNGRKGELIERKNRSNGNTFYGCSAYPQCKHAEPIDGEAPKQKYSKRNSGPKEEDIEVEGTEEDLDLDIGSDK